MVEIKWELSACIVSHCLIFVPPISLLSPKFSLALSELSLLSIDSSILSLSPLSIRQELTSLGVIVSFHTFPCWSLPSSLSHSVRRNPCSNLLRALYRPRLYLLVGARLLFRMGRSAPLSCRSYDLPLV